MTHLKGIANSLTDFDGQDRKEIIQNMIDGNNDFEVNDYRFIHESDIDEIMVDELSGDTYMLGCFNDWFIADITGLDFGVVERAQKAENFELLGELMLKEIKEVQRQYVVADSYGHHFSHYDGCENTAGEYYFFRLN